MGKHEWESQELGPLAFGKLPYKYYHHMPRPDAIPFGNPLRQDLFAPHTVLLAIVHARRIQQVA